MGALEDIEYLKSMYRNTSRHSQYQIMPDFLADLVDPDRLNKKFNRYERERMAYFAKKVNFTGAKVLDVGGNTGYFSFEALTYGACEAVCYEGNKEHVDFVRLAARLYDKDVAVRQEYLDFSGPLKEGDFDIAMILNVLHHVGFDFGEKNLTIEHAKELILKNLNYFADKSTYVIFQIGFSWMTNYDHPLFKNGSKAEMIDMITRGISGYWDIVSIGIAEVDPNGTTEYKDLNDRNVLRNDSIGEFRNRPIFILKSVIRS